MTPPELAGKKLSSPGQGIDFNFDAHARQTVEQYRGMIGQYEDFASCLEGLLSRFASGSSIPIHTLESRAKTVEGLRGKASQASEENPNEPKYSNPLDEITDLAGVRIITFFLESVSSFEEIVNREFTVLEKTDKSDLLEREERLGYHSVHYIVSLTEDRLRFQEYSRFRGLKAEIQIRTILQHAWAEIEHDVQYKAQKALPAQIRRRFMTLVGLLEIADREFQEIQAEDARLRENAKNAVEAGNLTKVEITAEALKAYLDRKYSPDGRMTPAAYNFTARLLHRLGFSDLDEVEAAVKKFDDDKISRLLTKSRQGQLTRFEFVLLASLGSYFIHGHQLGKYEWFQEQQEAYLEKA